MVMTKSHLVSLTLLKRDKTTHYYYCISEDIPLICIHCWASALINLVFFRCYIHLYTLLILIKKALNKTIKLNYFYLETFVMMRITPK